MKTITNTILLAAAICAAALCQAEPVKLKVGDALDLGAGLRSLDGYMRVIGSGESARTVASAYDFAPATRWAIAENIAEVKNAEAAFQSALQGVIKALAPEGGATEIDKDPELSARFAAEAQKLRGLETTLELTRFARDDLKLDANAIPPSALAQLRPVLKK